MQQKTLLSAEISDSYAFKNILCIIRKEIGEISIVFSLKEITIAFINRDNYAIHEINLDPKNFMSYVYDFEDCPHYSICVKSEELLNATKNIGKRDGIKLSYLEADNNLIVEPIKCCNVISTNTTFDNPSKQATKSLVRIVHTENVLDLQKMPQNYDKYIEVDSKDFSLLCSQACSMNSSFMRISGCSTYILFEGINAENIILVYRRYTAVQKVNLNEEVDEKSAKHIIDANNGRMVILQDYDLLCENIPSKTVKTLSKLCNISNNKENKNNPKTNLLFYLSPGAPLRIQSPISNYGIYNIIIKTPVDV